MTVPDEELVAQAQQGDTRALELLADRYDGAAVWCAAKFFDRAAEQDDLRQEARIGILDAVRNWRPGAGASFTSFVFLCCKRQVIDAVRVATGRKQLALTEAVRVARDDVGEEIGSIDAFEDPHGDPLDVLTERAHLAAVVRTIRDDLTPLEREWLVDHVFCGRSYKQRGVAIDKSADNALQRARRKLAVALKDAA